MSGKFRGCNTVSVGGWSRWGAGLTLVVVAVVMMALAIPSSALAVSEAFTPQRITTGATQASHQKVSGDRIVWQASDGAHLAIYTWTPTGGAVKLTSATTDQTLPEVSGDRVVWQGSDGVTSQIYTWTQTGGVAKVSDTTTNNTAPQISGDRIVWQASDGADLEIYTWTPTGGVEKVTDNSTDDTKPQVSGDRIVWQGLSGAASEIYSWTVADGVVQVNDSTSTNNAAPQVSGNRVAWQGSDGTDLEIYSWTPTAGVVKVSNNGSTDTAPQVSGDTVVWTNYSTDYQAYMWTPTGGASNLSDITSPASFDPTPQVDGDRIVWVGADGDVLGWVASWRSAVGPIPVTYGNFSVSGPQVSGSRVVWAQQTSTGGAFDIYTATARTIPDPTITSVSPNFGPGSGGTTVTINGTGFDDTYGVDVTFGGVGAKNIKVVSDKKVTAVAPAHPAGTVQVKVTTWVGETADTANDDFLYIASPGTSEAFKTATIARFGTGIVAHGDWSSISFTDLSISSNRLAWDAYDGTAWQVYTWDPVAGTQKISTNSHDNGMPIVSGDRVAWTSIDNTTPTQNWQVFTWTPTGGTVQVTQGGQQGGASDVDGDRVVWSGTDSATGADSEIFLWTPTTGSIAITSNAVDDVAPTISGNRIAWQIRSGGTDLSPNYDIMTWTAAGGAVRLTNNAKYNDVPDVSGDRVVWTDGQNVYTWTAGTTTPLKLTAAGTTGSHVSPLVDGSRVVWTASVGQGNDSVYTWTPTAGTVCLAAEGVEPDMVAVSGDRVVWSGANLASMQSGGQFGDIYSWTPGAGITMVSSGKGDSYGPCVSSDRLAWVSDDGIDTTVISALPIPTVNSITANHGLPAGGNTVTISGTGFHGVTGASGVTFAGVNATSYTVNSSTKITAVVPAHALGTVEVVVNGSEGSSPTEGPANDYSYAYPRFDQKDSRLGYTGTWASYGNAGFVGGTDACTKMVGATVTAAFNGTLFNWIGATGPDMGKAAVSVDGGAPTEVDLYSASTLLGQKVFSIDGLAQGAHTVRITCEGTKNASSTSTYINVDAVETDGSLTAFAYAEQNDVRLGYQGSWQTYANANFSGGSYAFSKTAGSSVTVPFNGQRLDWIATVGPVYGNANVSIDGKTPVQVDLYSATYKYKQTVFSTGNLAAGLHTVKISYTGTRNPLATDTYINTDAFQIVGSVASASRFDQTSAKLVYAKTWTLGSGSHYYGSNYRYVNASGASVTINFTGAGLTYIAKKATNMGKVSIRVDGGPAVLVDLYAATAQYQQRVWSTGVLAAGNHTVTISWTGQRRAGATGTYINIDAVDVIGTLR